MASTNSSTPLRICPPRATLHESPRVSVVVVVYVAFVDVCRGGVRGSDVDGSGGGRSVENPADQYTPASVGLTRPSYRLTLTNVYNAHAHVPIAPDVRFPLQSFSKNNNNTNMNRTSFVPYEDVTMTNTRAHFSISSSIFDGLLSPNDDADLLDLGKWRWWRVRLLSFPAPLTWPACS